MIPPAKQIHTPRSNPGQVLVVEDDPISRSYLECALIRHGYAVTLAADVNQAQEQIGSFGIHWFDCVVSDFRMPGHTGLELLGWIKARDPGLATIIVTAEGERSLIAESLRHGAFDFLDKPINVQTLQATVGRAVKQSRRQRQLAESESAIQAVGRTQERMLIPAPGDSPVRVDICFHPKREAGGDFFIRFPLSAAQHVCLLTDVSGHDLQAAYVSAIFQGVVRGMLECAAPVESVFTTFNRLLLSEWNQPDVSGLQPATTQASVAACAILIDLSLRTATVWTNGLPAPVFWGPDGSANLIGTAGGSPLGWFPDVKVTGAVQRVISGGTVCLWTDGLTAVVESLGVSELSMVAALHQAKLRGAKLVGLDSAADDILVAEISLLPLAPEADAFRPLIVEQYHGSQFGEIDEFQAFWERSLAMAVPEIPAAKMHDILLASREALLNALRHGCDGRPERNAGFQVAYSPNRRAIRVRVCDPGPGHEFQLEDHEQKAAEELIPGHRGLILLKYLSTQLETERNGATVAMDFEWP